MINKTIFQGRLTADVELKQTQSGISFAEFTVAWSEKYKEIESKCFLRCKAWRNTAEFISKYFKKGQEVAIEGRVLTEQWEKDGQPQSRTICEVEKAYFCGNKQNTGTSPTDRAPVEPKLKEVNTDDDLPF